ncbi:hypothetical protein [Candidatus Entotheonella palauensis]|uniref:Lipoprotein n=1 Tax=Candidatus Entotheonella gemina TaxID=1429439 RepID=W4LC77_9BACT|nr:hypothetical protein [Candidatus Entotheonella palauensis]ETW95300.1 MAG: hypothetical protein ETSY2_48340 [Candidatus Entotheonella gemina]
MKRTLLFLTFALVASLVLSACAVPRTPTVTIPDGTLQKELVSKSQNVGNFALLEVPFVLASGPKHPANVDLKFHIVTRGY